MTSHPQAKEPVDSVQTSFSFPGMGVADIMNKIFGASFYHPVDTPAIRTSPEKVLPGFRREHHEPVFRHMVRFLRGDDKSFRERRYIQDPSQALRC